jgi:NAD(P)-dependent dehydrogenase (short-subunit alcohol dehydrogenase family)
VAAAGPITERRVCLLTGASGTLGSEFCRLFGSKYAIAAVYATRLPKFASQRLNHVDPLRGPVPRKSPNSVYAIRANLFDDGDVGRVVELTLARFGKIDLLVNAAVFSRWASALDTNDLIDSAMQQLEMNVLVPLKLAVTLARQFWRHREGENAAANRNVINVSSSAGVYIYPNAKQIMYSASKAALNYLSCHLADEFAAIGVRVNAVAPNAFPGIVPTRRVAECIHEIDGGDMNGQILVVDKGGETSYSP